MCVVERMEIAIKCFVPKAPTDSLILLVVGVLLGRLLVERLLLNWFWTEKVQVLTCLPLILLALRPTPSAEEEAANGKVKMWENNGSSKVYNITSTSLSRELD
jgi:hypothetical protein